MNPKEYIPGILLVLCGAVVGFFWKGIPDTPALSVLIVLYASLFGFYLLFARQASLRYTLPAISLGALALTLGVNQFVLEGLALAILFISIAAWTSEYEYQNSVSFAPRRVVSRSLKFFFTALAILFAFAYYGDTHTSAHSVNQLLPRNVFEISLKAAQAPLSRMLPGFTAESTVDDILIAMATQESAQVVAPRPISRAQLSAMVKQNRTQILRELERQLGIDLDIARIKGTEKISDVLYDVSVAKAEEYLRSYIGYLPIIIAVSYFLALKTVSIVVYFISIAVILIALKALMWFGVVHKDTTMVAKEVIY